MFGKIIKNIAPGTIMCIGNKSLSYGEQAEFTLEELKNIDISLFTSGKLQYIGAAEDELDVILKEGTVEIFDFARESAIVGTVKDKMGAVIFNSDPDAGEPIGWVCIVPGMVSTELSTYISTGISTYVSTYTSSFISTYISTGISTGISTFISTYLEEETSAEVSAEFSVAISTEISTTISEEVSVAMSTMASTTISTEMSVAISTEISGIWNGFGIIES